MLRNIQTKIIEQFKFNAELHEDINFSMNSSSLSESLEFLITNETLNSYKLIIFL